MARAWGTLGDWSSEALGPPPKERRCGVSGGPVVVPGSMQRHGRLHCQPGSGTIGPPALEASFISSMVLRNSPLRTRPDHEPRTSAGSNEKENCFMRKLLADRLATASRSTHWMDSSCGVWPSYRSPGLDRGSMTGCGRASLDFQRPLEMPSSHRPVRPRSPTGTARSPPNTHLGTRKTSNSNVAPR
jgi:hypothetical protein